MIFRFRQRSRAVDLPLNPHLRRDIGLPPLPFASYVRAFRADINSNVT
jgi:hypothetical protein